MIESVTEASLLYDFYGQLLTERKRQVMELYHEENYTLTEIAEEFGISRAAVYDALKSAEKSLLEYEKKLGLVTRLRRTESLFREIDGMLAEIITRHSSNPEIVKSLKEVQSVIDRLEEI